LRLEERAALVDTDFVQRAAFNLPMRAGALLRATCGEDISLTGGERDCVGLGARIGAST
jgi:hypothetical protein